VTKIGSMNHIVQYDLRGYKGRLLYCSDVHGHFDLLGTELRNMAFSPGNGDLLFSGGDWIDRGPQSGDVLKWLNKTWVHSVQGNHEDMHIQAFQSNYNYQVCYNAATLAQHGGLWAFTMLDEEPEKLGQIINRFEELPIAMELLTDWGTVGIIHADVPYSSWESFKNVTRTEFENHILGEAQWSRRRYKGRDVRGVDSVDLVLVGHTPTRSTKVEQLGNVVYTDAGTIRSGNINIVEINKDLFKKVKENEFETGETRLARS